jgi:V/A-type H+-transporting ATPase subunit K
MSIGVILGFSSVALVAALGGFGSIFGVSIAGRVANGVLAEKPKMFGSLVVLTALPGTQGMYGFLMAILLLVKLGVLGGSVVPLTNEEGWKYVMAALPCALTCFLSGIYQGKVAGAAISMLAKQPKSMVSGLMLTSLVEIYAILGLLASILLYGGL